MHKAIGDQLTCVFVDQGMMRLNEASSVVEMFTRTFKVPLVHVDAKERFLSKLAGVTDPERKRKIIGEEFIRCFEEEAAKLDRRPLPRAGHALPGRHRERHQAGGQDQEPPQRRRPARRRWASSSSSRCALLFKDEVRAVGEELGLPEPIVWRQPFPGPGLGIRIIGEITAERVDILQRADAILQDEIRAAGLYRELWQCFAILPVIRSVGVQGDERTYAYPIVVRAVKSEDAMTADWARLPYDLLERISNRIINEVADVNRVVLDISSKPPSTIEWE